MIYDVIILGILVLFTIIGFRRGLILSLSGLIGIIVAFVGAGLLAGALQQPLGDVFYEPVRNALENQVEEYMAEQTASGESFISAPDALTDALGEGSVFVDVVEEILSDTVESNLPSLLEKAGTAIAQTIAWWLTAIVTFILILTLWRFLSKLVDGVFQMSVLRVLNRTGGLLFGFVEAVLLVMVFSRVLQMMGFLSKAGESALLPIFLG